jgi:hypothetical protein
MPYTKDQCKAFGAKARRGERVPSDWKEHCASGRAVSKKQARKHTSRKK